MMRRCMIWILLVMVLFSACTAKKAPETTPTEASQATQPSSPTDSTTESTQPPVSAEKWYSKIDVENWYFDNWLVKVTEWNDMFYYIADGNLYRWDIATETEELLVSGNIRGLFVYEDRFYYYTDCQIFQLDFGIEYLSVLIWEHPERDNDSVDGILGLMIHDGWFYIKDSGTSAIRYNPKTGLTEEFPGYFSHFVFVNDRCYYIDRIDKTFSIYEVDTETKEFTLVRGDGVSKRYGESGALYFDELRSVNGQLYFLIRDLEQFYCFYDNGKDKQFYENAWIFDSYLYPNLCYSIKDGGYVHIYEEDEFGKANLILSVPKEDIYIGAYNSACFMVTESAVFYKADEKSPVQFAWKYPDEKD